MLEIVLTYSDTFLNCEIIPQYQSVTYIMLIMSEAWMFEAHLWTMHEDFHKVLL